MSGTRELVLVGGGHSHIQTLAHFAEEPPPACNATMVVDLPVAVYSGMVPGFVAGQYRKQEVEIDVVELCRRAGVRVVIGRVTGVDANDQRIVTEDGGSVPYDVATFDIGSTVAGLDLPGVREHSLPTRPIGSFCDDVDALVEAVRREPPVDPVRVVVVGGGAGGVELAFTLEHRLRSLGAGVDVRLMDGGPRILGTYSASLRRRVRRNARRRGIEITCERRVEAVDPDAVLLEGGERIAYDVLVWVAGSRSPSVFVDSGLATDDRGFVLTRSTLQFRDHDNLFAAGDCGTLVDFPGTPKAGVYAVRQGPYLTHNLLAWLRGAPLRTYEPQSDFLVLMNLGDGRAVGAKWGFAFEGRWVMRLKDRIDREFVGRFQGGPSP